MKIWRIKWENIFGLITSTVLLVVIIKYIMINGFDISKIIYDLIYASLSVLAVMWCAKMTRKFYLEN